MGMADSVLGLPANFLTGWEYITEKDTAEYSAGIMALAQNFTCVMKERRANFLDFTAKNA